MTKILSKKKALFERPFLFQKMDFYIKSGIPKNQQLNEK